jgi:hypothetical protein
MTHASNKINNKNDVSDGTAGGGLVLFELLVLKLLSKIFCHFEIIVWMFTKLAYVKNVRTCMIARSIHMDEMGIGRGMGFRPSISNGFCSRL